MLALLIPPAAAEDVKNPTPLIINDASLQPGGSGGVMVGGNGSMAFFNDTSVIGLSSGVNVSLSRIAWRPDGSYALIVGDDGTILKFENVRTGLVVIDSGTRDDLYSVSWKPDGTFALVSGEQGMMLRFDHGLQKIFRISTGFKERLTDISWDLSGEHAEIKGDGGTILTYPPVLVSFPVIGIVAPGSGETISGEFTVRGVSSVESGVIYRIEIKIDNGIWSLAGGTSWWEAVIDTAVYSNGAHLLGVRAWTTEGISRTISSGITIFNERLPPVLTVQFPSEWQKVSGMMSARGTSASFYGSLERIDIRLDDHGWEATRGTDCWQVTADTTTFSNGIHKLQCRAWDGASFTVVTRYFIVENAPPQSIAMPHFESAIPAPHHPAPVADVLIQAVLPGPQSEPEISQSPEPAATGSPGPLTDGGTITVQWFSVGLLMLSGLALGTEHGKFALYQFLFVPLYSRIKKDRVLDNFTRGMIYGFIMSHPGVHYNFIKEKLGLNNGSIVYHLTVLERQELIKSEKVGLYKRFYPAGRNLADTGIMELNESQERLLDIVEQAPGITQREMADRSGMSTRVINYHIGLLQRARLVRLERIGKVTKCFATERMPVC